MGEKRRRWQRSFVNHENPLAENSLQDGEVTPHLQWRWRPNRSEKRLSQWLCQLRDR
jgi:hypothetical protein